MKIVNKFKHKIQFPYRYFTSNIRMNPEFLIIGVQKGGTTSLYNYLNEHPEISKAFEKEVHYFDNNFEKSDKWYKAHFPIQSSIKEKNNLITGDASPYYFFHPLVPKRVYDKYPKMKLIILLRDPIIRAYSHFQHNIRNKRENRSFEEAILEEKLIEEEENKIINHQVQNSYYHQHFSYLSRGLYYKQINKWLEFFPIEQFCILNSEEFYSAPLNQLDEVVRFLNLKEWEFESNRVFNSGGTYKKISSDTIEYLKEYYYTPNEKLFKLINRRFENWF